MDKSTLPLQRSGQTFVLWSHLSDDRVTFPNKTLHPYHVLSDGLELRVRRDAWESPQRGTPVGHVPLCLRAQRDETIHHCRASFLVCCFKSCHVTLSSAFLRGDMFIHVLKLVANLMRENCSAGEARTGWRGKGLVVSRLV